MISIVIQCLIAHLDSAYHSNPNASATQCTDNMGNVVSQWINDCYESNQNKTGFGFVKDSLLISLTLRISWYIASLDDLASKQQASLSLAGVEVLELFKSRSHCSIQRHSFTMLGNVVRAATDKNIWCTFNCQESRHLVSEIERKMPGNYSRVIHIKRRAVVEGL